MSNSMTKYIKLFEDEMDNLAAVGVSEPEQEPAQPVDVEIDYTQDYQGIPQKNVHVYAGDDFHDGTDPEALRSALKDAGVPIPDEEGSEPNSSGISVSVSNTGSIAAHADDEAGEELLSILKNAGLYQGRNDAQL